MTSNRRSPIRGELRRALERDFSQRARRDPRNRTFWRSMGVLGAIGWSIALPSVGGAYLGHLADGHWGTGVRFTLLGLMLGVLLGSAVAAQLVRGTRA